MTSQQEIKQYLADPARMQEIEQYLADPAKMYEMWYRTVYAPTLDATTHPVGYLPNLEGIKDRFKYWFNHSQEWIKQNICPHWKKWRDMPNSHKIREVLIAIAADTTSVVLIPGLHIYHIPIIVVILVTEGYLDRLCPHHPES